MIKLEPLTGHHNRSAFDCGTAALNAWLKQTALQHQGKGISRTFVAVAADQDAVQACIRSGYQDVCESTILGYYALASAFVTFEQLPPSLSKRYPRQIPVTRLGRLAVRADMQAQGLGELLLLDAMGRARNAAQQVGSAGLFVDVNDAKAARFYQKYGFQPGDEEALTLYLALW
jgi:GNAT superfamily N-acetyltransferase